MKSIVMCVAVWAFAAFAENKPAAVFQDKGDTFVRLGSKDGIEMGQDIDLLGEKIGDTQERRVLAKAVVIEVFETIARLKIDDASAKTAQWAKASTKNPTAKTATVTDKTSTETKTANGAILKGHASMSGVAFARRITVHNDSKYDWTGCDIRLTNNKHYVISRLKAGDSEGIMWHRFSQDGVVYDKDNEGVTVRCVEGQGKFGFSY